MHQTRMRSVLPITRTLETGKEPPYTDTECTDKKVQQLITQAEAFSLKANANPSQ